jgi:2-keto-4-pentenoate hydratase/2-oxohepta-3-ene-1,7-dioic acid hydratase in catechol pathway
MRLATIIDEGRELVAVVEGDRMLPIRDGSRMRDVAAAGPDGLRRMRGWVAAQTDDRWRPLGDAILGPAVPDPGAIYTIGLNYRPADAPDDDPERPPRPLVYGKVPTSVAGHDATLRWDRDVTPNVDAEVELGVVVGVDGGVFGYTIIDDVSSRDPWLDGDQWLLGKSMAGFCPVGPWIVTADEFDPTQVRLGCRLGDAAIQDGSTAAMRYTIDDVLAYLARHVTLQAGDLIATGTPPRLSDAPGPDRHLEAGDVVTCWIEGIGELRTIVA